MRVHLREEIFIAGGVAKSMCLCLAINYVADSSAKLSKHRAMATLASMTAALNTEHTPHTSAASSIG